MPKSKHKVKSYLISDMFYLSPSQITKDYALGVPYDEIYTVFNNENLTVGQKKRYLYDTAPFKQLKKNKTENLKDKVWNRFQGDALFIKTSLYDNNINIKINEILGV